MLRVYLTRDICRFLVLFPSDISDTGEPRFIVNIRKHLAGNIRGKVIRCFEVEPRETLLGLWKMERLRSRMFTPAGNVDKARRDGARHREITRSNEN